MSAEAERTSRVARAAAGARTFRPAFRSPVAICFFLLFVCAGLAADLLSKHYVFRSFLGSPALPERVEALRADFPARHGRQMTAKDALSRLRRRVCPGVWFSLSTNAGVVFGLPMPRWAIALASAAAVALVGLYFAASGHRARWIHAALALILAGAMGNLYDRLFSEVRVPGFAPIRHHVRDFIDCSELYYGYVFNLADAFLVAGVAMLIFHRLASALRPARGGTRGPKT